jgi:hypothetical protein
VVKKYVNGVYKTYNGSLESDGYKRAWISLYADDSVKRIRIPIHRLVASAFIDRPVGCDIVNHLDNIRHHNYDYNLEWTTQKDNIQYCIHQGRRRSDKGEDNPGSILNEIQIIRVCELILSGFKNKQISSIILDEFITSIHPNTICDIRKRRTWNHVTNAYL